MSSKYSPLEQSKNLYELFTKTWHMEPEDTLINVVDFGGDILTNGKQSSIISPGLDAYSLAVARNLETSYQYLCKLSVCFPGVDGELPNHYISNVCNTHNIKKDQINMELWTKILGDVYAKIKIVRPGNTIPNMLTILDSMKLDKWKRPTIEVRKQWVVGKIKSAVTINADLNWDLQPYIYTFDLNSICNPFVSVFLDDKNYNLLKVFNHIMSVYKQQDKHSATVQSSDLHLQYLRNDLYGKWTNKHILFPLKPTDKCIQEVLFIDVIPCVERLKIEMETIKTSGIFNVSYTLQNK
jgi:hypothetical protein